MITFFPIHFSLNVVFVALAITGLTFLYRGIINSNQINAGLKNESLFRRKFDSILRHFDSISTLSSTSKADLIREYLSQFLMSLIGCVFIKQILNLEAIHTVIFLLLINLTLLYRLTTLRKRVVKKYIFEVERKFPEFVENLSLAVSSGLSFRSAFIKVCESELNTPHDSPLNSKRANNSPFWQELSLVKKELGQGITLGIALEHFSARVNSSMVNDFVDAVVLSLTRGTPVTSMLQEHAASIRDYQRRIALERAAKAEVKMMVPVVFLLLPISVLFALWPSLQQLQQLVVIP